LHKKNQINDQLDSKSKSLLSGITPYSGPWNRKQAAHLLRRATFGATYEQIKEATSLGMDAIVDLLLENHPLPDPPINYDQNLDIVAIGETWINAPLPTDVNQDEISDVRASRRFSLYGWQHNLMLQSGLSIIEKMTLFWHNHFPIERGRVQDAKYLYRYINLLRSSALGNFKQLVKDITEDPAMLRYLDGKDNTKFEPNENYARELLELFTVGKGPQIGPGDYSTFTELDVTEISRVLTGWDDTGYQSQEVGEIFVTFNVDQHDVAPKTLSYHFSNAVIINANDSETNTLIEVIFLEEIVALEFCRKLYKWFVNFQIDAEVETSIIQPLAQCLRDNNYNVKPVLRALLTSQYFYEADIKGAIIKNPYEFVFSVFKQMEVTTSEDPAIWYHSLQTLDEDYLVDLGMRYFDPPSVAGWTPYYLSQHYQLWINSVTLGPRLKMITDITSEAGFYLESESLKINALQFLNKLDNPADIKEVIDETTFILLPESITNAQKDFLKEILIPGLPDFEWTVEYVAYLNNPNNPDLAMAIANRMSDFLRAVMSMPEFQLI